MRSKFVPWRLLAKVFCRLIIIIIIIINNNNFYLYSAVYPDIKPVQRRLKYNICKT